MADSNITLRSRALGVPVSASAAGLSAQNTSCATSIPSGPPKAWVSGS
jgi:hypothetical protein